MEPHNLARKKNKNIGGKVLPITHKHTWGHTDINFNARHYMHTREPGYSEGTTDRPENLTSRDRRQQ